MAGRQIAAANAKEKCRVLRAVVRANLLGERKAGEGGHEKKDARVRRRIAFPPAVYAARGGGTVLALDWALAALESDPEPGPDLVPTFKDRCLERGSRGNDGG